MNPYDSLLECIDATLIFAVDVVKCSRYVQHSLTPLDLSIGECSYSSLRRKNLNIPRTLEALEKLLLQPSRILQTLNIDSPNHFKRRFENLKDTLCPDSSFLVARFKLSPDVYFKNLSSDIMKCIEKSSDLQGNVKKYMKVAQMIKLSAAFCICSLHMLMSKNCQDSYLVQQVFEAGFKDTLLILDVDYEPFIDFILFHSQKIDFDPFGPPWIIDLTPLDYSLFNGKFRIIPSLLKYGYQFLNTKYGALAFLYTHENPKDAKLVAECFRLFWSSIPDCLSNESEPKLVSPMNLIFSGGPSLYTKVLEHDPDFCPGRPRSLAHQCRCAIRTLLTKKRALPGGIEVLGLPMDLQAYLRLEH